MSSVVHLEFTKCCECGARATRKLELVDADNAGPVIFKHFCNVHFPEPMTDDELRLLVDRRDATIADLAQTMTDALALLRDTDVQSLSDRIGNAILTLDLALKDLAIVGSDRREG